MQMPNLTAQYRPIKLLGQGAMGEVYQVENLAAERIEALKILKPIADPAAREIAHARGTSFFTVRNQLSALYRRLEVGNRAEAIGLRRGRRAP